MAVREVGAPGRGGRWRLDVVLEGGWRWWAGREGGREEGGGAPGEGDICSPCIFHKGEIERWERARKGERERQTCRQVPAPGWDEEQRLEKKWDRRHSLPGGSRSRGVGELGCVPVLCRHPPVSSRVMQGSAGATRGVGEHRWVLRPRTASPRQALPAATPIPIAPCLRAAAKFTCSKVWGGKKVKERGGQSPQMLL